MIRILVVEDETSSPRRATQLMDRSRGEASSKPAPEKLTPAAANNPDYDEPSHDIDTVDAFKEAISHQAAARAARPRLTYFERQQAIREVYLKERVSRLLRSFKLVLAFAIGAAVLAGIMYYALGIHLW